MRGVQTSGSPRCGLLTAVLVALSCALLWNVVLLNQKVACDVAAGRIKADAELTINTLRSQNDRLKTAVADGDCARSREDAERCAKEKSDMAAAVPSRRVAVIMFCYNRPEYLERALNNLLKYLPASYSLVVSQDSNDAKVAELLARPQYHQRLLHIQHTVTRTDWREKGKGSLSSYYFISSHYRFGLSTVFDKLQYDAAILLEDDLEVAPDFFSYFAATLPLLERDPSLYCVSAWNDNGNPDFVDKSHHRELRRSDFFPGLGWLMTRRLWAELGPRWPDGFWDDWMRLGEQRRGRHCLYPEVSRTYTFGAVGASQGQFFKDHLASIVLNQQPVDWAREDLSYLRADQWDARFEQELAAAASTVVASVAELRGLSERAVTMYYDTEAQFKELAAAARIMTDSKEGVPRTAYRGVVKFHAHTNTVYLRPRTLPPAYSQR